MFLFSFVFVMKGNNPQTGVIVFDVETMKIFGTQKRGTSDIGCLLTVEKHINTHTHHQLFPLNVFICGVSFHWVSLPHKRFEKHKAYLHCIAKCIHPPIQIIEFRCSNHFHGHMICKIKHLMDAELHSVQVSPTFCRVNYFQTSYGLQISPRTV